MLLRVSMQHSLDTVQNEVRKFSLDICLPYGRKSCLFPAVRFEGQLGVFFAVWLMSQYLLEFDLW